MQHEFTYVDCSCSPNYTQLHHIFHLTWIASHWHLLLSSTAATALPANHTVSFHVRHFSFPGSQDELQLRSWKKVKPKFLLPTPSEKQQHTEFFLFIFPLFFCINSQQERSIFLRHVNILPDTSLKIRAMFRPAVLENAKGWQLWLCCSPLQTIHLCCCQTARPRKSLPPRMQCLHLPSQVTFDEGKGNDFNQPRYACKPNNKSEFYHHNDELFPLWRALLRSLRCCQNMVLQSSSSPMQKEKAGNVKKPATVSQTGKQKNKNSTKNEQDFISLKY